MTALGLNKSSGKLFCGLQTQMGIYMTRVVHLLLSVNHFVAKRGTVKEANMPSTPIKGLPLLFNFIFHCYFTSYFISYFNEVVSTKLTLFSEIFP